LADTIRTVEFDQAHADGCSGPQAESMEPETYYGQRFGMGCGGVVEGAHRFDCPQRRQRL